MPEEESSLEVQVGLNPDADAELLDEATRQLRRELLELDVERVARAREGPPPAGTRAVDAATVGGLIVTLAKTTPVLTAIVRTLTSWVSRGEGRNLKIQIDGDTLELSRISTADQERLISAWIERHATEG
jgi:hypothetical protein